MAWQLLAREDSAPSPDVGFHEAISLTFTPWDWLMGQGHPVFFRSLTVLALGAAALACNETSAPSGSFAVTPGQVNLVVNETVQLTAVEPPGVVDWSSSNSGVATVIRETGYVRAVGRGEATVSAVSGSHVATATIDVTLPPGLGLSGSTLEFTGVEGGQDPAQQSVSATNTGDGSLTGIAVGSVTYGAGQPGGWLSASSSSATAPATLTFEAHTAGLARGIYTATVPVVADGVANSPQNVSVLFTVQGPASIELSQESVELTAIQGASAQATVQVTNGGDVPLGNLSSSVSYGPGAADWLQATLGGTVPASLELGVDATGLAPGQYSAVVTVAASAAGVASRDLPVTFTVTPGPAIVLSVDSLQVQATYGISPGAQTVTVANGGGGTLQGVALGAVVYVAGGTDWLEPALNAGGTSVTLSFNSGALGTGTHLARVEVLAANATNSPQMLTVVLAVGAAPTLGLMPAVVSLSAQQGGTDQADVAVTSSGAVQIDGLTRTVSYLAGQPTGWLTANLAGTATPTTVALQANATGLNPGTYNATVRLTSSNPDIPASDIQVNLSVGALPRLELTPASVQATTAYGSDASPESVVIANSGGGTLSGLSLDAVQYQGGASGWLTPVLSPGANGGTLQLNFQSASLGAGVYDATVVVRSAVADNSPQNLSVQLTVNSPPTMAANPGTLNFSAWGDQTNATQPAAQSVVVSSTGGVAGGLSRNIAYNGGASGWLSAVFRNGTSTTPAILDVRPLTTNLSAGTYQATITINSSTPGVTARTVSVTYTVQTFSTNLFPSLATCGNCHSSVGPVYSSNALTYCSRVQFYAVNPSATTASQLYQRVIANPGTAHTGGKYPALATILLSWIVGNTPGGPAPCR